MFSKCFNTSDNDFAYKTLKELIKDMNWNSKQNVLIIFTSWVNQK